MTSLLTKSSQTQTSSQIQYNAALAITGAITGTSKQKIYNELGLEYLKDRRWMRRLCLSHKIYNLESTKYLYNLISSVLMILEITQIGVF